MSRRLLNRRHFLGSSLLFGTVACSGTSDPEAPLPAPACPAPGPASPLAQDYTVAARVPVGGNHYYMHDPGMALLPSGTILVAAPTWQVAGAGQVGAIAVRVLLTRSSDGGRTWESLPSLDGMSDATPFVHDGGLYLFIQAHQFGAFMLVKSEDEGRTWSSPVTIFDDGADKYWNCSTPMVVQNGKRYWAVQSGPGFQGDMRVIAADLSKSLLAPATWQRSSPAARPLTPPAVVPAGSPPGDHDTWLEPNIVSVGGKIRVIARTNLADYRTPSLPIVCDLVEDATGMHLAFSQFCPAPGGQNKCFILRDDASPRGMFWMLSNLPADAQGTVLDWQTIEKGGRFLPGPGNDRRFLMLSYSLDALSWFPAGCVARAALLRQSFMYPSAAIDGHDLVLVSRTSVDGDTQHNADLVTFHRVRDFRSLAMDLYPDSLDG